MYSDISDSYKIMESTLLDTTGFISQDSPEIKGAIARIKRVADYNLQGMQYTGNSVVSAFNSVKENQGIQVTDQDLLLAVHGVSWANQIAQAAYLIGDDIMDSSHTRFGKNCWTRLPEIGITAVNDIMTLMNFSYVILDRLVKKHPQYPFIRNIFTDIAHKTCVGQDLDNHAGPVADWTMNTFYTISDYKAGYPMSDLIRQGIYLAGVDDAIVHTGLEEILMHIGMLVQVQNDYLDVYGKKNKNASDISNGKCSWLIARALEKADQAQRKTLIENYGVNKAESVERVKKVFEELDIRNDLLDFEKKQHTLAKQKCEDFCEKGKSSPQLGKHGFPIQTFDYLFAFLESRSAREI
jgi:farnesyl diphosphate synthase